MVGESVVAPTLSTLQDESDFQYVKTDTLKARREYLSLSEKASREELTTRIRKYYSIDEIVHFLRQKCDRNAEKFEGLRFKSITLQFPDQLLCDSAIVTQLLQQDLEKLNALDAKKVKNSDMEESWKEHLVASYSQKLWVLADTSYSPCCIDEVAAEHVLSDVVIHFGDACLNKVEKIPVAYVFGRPHADLDGIINDFKRTYEDRFSNIVLISDASYNYIIYELYLRLKGEYPKLVYGDIDLSETPTFKIIDYHSRNNDKKSSIHYFNRIISGLDEMPVDNAEEYFGSSHLFHITKPEAPRLLQFTTRFDSVTLYDPVSNSLSKGPFPSLMRRYKYMHVARTAGTIGILVNTLSLENTKTLIDSIGKRIKDANKKHYIFVVGKPTTAKLANFESIDVWCILGCDYLGIIIDQGSEYFKPIITPYELILALREEVSWTGKWVTDYKAIFNELKKDEETNSSAKNDIPDDLDDFCAPEFDVVSGELVSSSKPLKSIRMLERLLSGDLNEFDNSSKELANRFSGTLSIKNTVSTSADRLQNRFWSGLGCDADDGSEKDDIGAPIEEGRVGTARGYQYDKHLNTNGS